MTTEIMIENNPVDLALNAAIQGIKKEDLESTKCSLNELTSQKNAYTYTNVLEKPTRWNMITYKKGKKSSL